MMKVRRARNGRAARRKRFLFSRVAWVFFLSCVLALAACRHETKQVPPPPPSVTVALPVKKLVTDYLELPGNTQAIQTVQLRARVAGYLEKVLFRDGQLVKRGDLLFLIQQDTYQSGLAQAEGSVLQQKTQLQYASKELERYTKLLAQNAAAQTDVDNWTFQKESARANLISATAARDLAKLNLGYTEVRAPFDGRIDRRLVDPGNLVGSSEVTVLASLSQIDPIYVYFNISDSDLARLMGSDWRAAAPTTSKRPVTMGILDEKGYPHQGVLDFASISLAPTTGTLLLRGTFPNPGNRIMPGLYVRVRVPVREKISLLVPAEAIGYDQQGSFVMTVGPGNVVQRSNVRTGGRTDRMVAIDEGLKSDQPVIVKGLQKAFPGRIVTPQREKSEGSTGPASLPPATAR